MHCVLPKLEKGFFQLYLVHVNMAVNKYRRFLIELLVEDNCFILKSVLAEAGGVKPHLVEHDHQVRTAYILFNVF